MKELSLNILDIAQNSLKAGAKNVGISLCEDDNHVLTMTITDDGCGMSEEMVKNVIDPFCTTRTTRKVGLGIPLLKLAAEQTGGGVSITSRPEGTYPDDHGTEVQATFHTDSIDFTPIGDVISTLIVLLQGNPDVDFLFKHSTPKGEVVLDTREMREVLGEDISLADYEILEWVRTYLEESYNQFS